MKPALSLEINPSPPNETRIGPYRLLEQIGEGGMGRVYLAERADGEYEQRVALKLVHLDEDETQLLPRFYQERQALAQLAHPNIARLLDGGVTESGQPYLVMEYIDGLPLDEYCERNHCDILTRVRLFRDVLAGVQHAHQHLFVHRDLKPSNILVTREGVPKLLDFGIAKWLQTTQVTPKLTRTGQQPMTPEYASPEQVRNGAVSTVSDVYALGVLLYELLTGHSPYRSAASDAYDLQKAIREEEPEQPSAVVAHVVHYAASEHTPAKALTPEAVSATRESSPRMLRRRLAGDLDSIVLKALRKEPHKRYGSAEQFSEDLLRYLEGRPVRAREGKLSYQAGKFVKRNAGKLAFATAFVGVIIGFAVYAAVQAEQIAQERDTAQQVSKFLSNIFTASDPNQSKGDSVTARELLDRGAEQVRNDLQDKPEMQAQLLYQIGEIYRKLGRLERAEPLLYESLAIRRRTFGNKHTDVTASQFTLGALLYNQGKYAEAEKIQIESLAINRELLGNQHYEVGVSASELGLTKIALGKFAEAETLFHEAEAVFRGLLPEAQEDLAGVLNNLGSLSNAKEDYATGERQFRELVEMARQVLPAGSATLAVPLKNLSISLIRQGKNQEAEPLLREAVQILESSFPRGHWMLASTRSGLGGCLISLQNYPEAESLFLSAQDYLQKEPTHDKKYLREARQGLVVLYEAWGKSLQAEEYRKLLLESLASN